MNVEIVEGRVTEFAGALLKHWGRLTDDEDAVARGGETEINGRIRTIHGRQREHAERLLKNWGRLDS